MSETNNPFIEEVKRAADNNPNVDIKLSNRWRRLMQQLEAQQLEVQDLNEIISHETEKKSGVERPRLQPIPLRMFERMS